MAMDSKSAGSFIQLDDLQSWYTQFTTFANNYGTTDMKPTMSDTIKPVAADYNTLVNIVTKYRSDDYLKTITWPDPITVNTGDKLTISTAKTALTNISTVQAKVKCRNSMTYSNENKSNGSGCSEKSYCSESYYNQGHISLSNTFYNCCQSRSYGCHRSYYTHSNQVNSNGSTADVLNSNASGTK